MRQLVISMKAEQKQRTSNSNSPTTAMAAPITKKRGTTRADLRLACITRQFVFRMSIISCPGERDDPLPPWLARSSDTGNGRATLPYRLCTGATMHCACRGSTACPYQRRPDELPDRSEDCWPRLPFYPFTRAGMGFRTVGSMEWGGGTGF